MVVPRWKEIEAENPWLETEYLESEEHPEIIEKYHVKETAKIFLDKEGKRNYKICRYSY